VDHAAVVRDLEGARDLTANIDRLVDGQRAALQTLGEIRAVDQLHDDEVGLPGVLDAVDGGDVALVQRRQQLGFAFEAAQPLGILRQLGREQLDRHLAIELAVDRLPHHAHPALADLLDESVVQKGLSGLDGHSRYLRGGPLPRSLHQAENGARNRLRKKTFPRVRLRSMIRAIERASVIHGGSVMNARAAIVAIAIAAQIPAVAFDGPPLKDGTTTPSVTPTIHFTEPRAGHLTREPERITIYFQRIDVGLDASSLELWIDGVEYTESLRFWVDRAWLDLPAGFWLSGTHLLYTQVRDAVGAVHSDDVAFELSPVALGVVYGWPFDYASPNVIGNLMEDYQGFLDVPQDEPYWHHGLDIRAPAHTPVYSVVDGYIAYKGPYLDGGSLQRDISVIGDDDIIWQYNHVNSSTWTAKQVGDPVAQGEFLANIENWPTVCCEVNGEPYHHLHLNAVELEGFDIGAWRALAQSPIQTPPAIPEPLGDNFKWFNPLLFLQQAGDLDDVVPEFDGQQPVAGPEIIFLANNTDDGIEPVANEIILSGDVDILARLRDTRDEIAGLLNPGQPYDVGVYEVSYKVTPLFDQCFKGWIPEKKLGTFDVVPGEYDGDDQDALLLDVFQMQFVYDGQTYDTLFDWGVNQRNFWYNVTNTKGGVLNHRWHLVSGTEVCGRSLRGDGLCP